MDSNQNREDSPPTDSGRRTFCKMCIGGMTVASAAMVGYPILGFMERPIKLGQGKPIEIALDSLVPGQADYKEFHGKQVIVLGTSKDPRVFSASCPHLGCNVIWSAADNVFRCPCHGAMFDSEGKVIRGPVSSNLTEIKYQKKDGKIIIS